MNFFDEHERFVRKNASLAKGFEIGRKDVKLEEKGVSSIRVGREPSCFNCKHRNKCQQFDKMRTGGSQGVVSYGGDAAKEGGFICDRYEIMKKDNPSMSDRQIKSLLKNAMRGNS